MEESVTHYHLRFPEYRNEQPKNFEFDAEDVVSALVIAHMEAPKQSAELWTEGRKICTIRRRNVSDADLLNILASVV